MTWLALLFAFEIGFMPNGTIDTYNVDSVRTNLYGNYYATLEVEAVLWDVLFVGGDVRTEMKKKTTNIIFWPHTMNYGFNAGLRLNPLEIGFRHRCIHPVVPWMYGKSIPIQWEGAYDEIYMRLELRD